MSDTSKKPTTKKATSKATAAAAAEQKTAASKPAVAKAAAAKAATASKIALVPRPHPTHEQISRRAYEIWAGRGYSHGNPHHDWQLAEQELKRA